MVADAARNQKSIDLRSEKLVGLFGLHLDFLNHNCRRPYQVAICKVGRDLTAVALDEAGWGGCWDNWVGTVAVRCGGDWCHRDDSGGGWHDNNIRGGLAIITLSLGGDRITVGSGSGRGLSLSHRLVHLTQAKSEIS